MGRPTRWLLAAGAMGALLAGATLAYFGDGHTGYRRLDPDVYHPTFFRRFAEADANGAAWTRNAVAVARTYVGFSRICPEQALTEISATAGRAVMVVTRWCAYSAYSAATVQEFRVELEQHAGAWTISWAGLRMKCALNRSPVGAYLLSHNPFRAVGPTWARPLSQAVDWLAGYLNPWLTVCL